jgi:hypothetical protein
MAKFTLPRFTSSFSITAKLNQVVEALEDLMQNRILYRDNVSGEPNQMKNLLDMDDHPIINLPDAVNARDAVNLQQLQAAVEATGGGPFVPLSALEGGVAGQILRNTGGGVMGYGWSDDEALSLIQGFISDLATKHGPDKIGFDLETLYEAGTIGEEVSCNHTGMVNILTMPGSTFTEKLRNALIAGGSYSVPEGVHLVGDMGAVTVSDTILQGHNATIKTTAGGNKKLILATGGRVSFRDITFDLVDMAIAATYFFYADELTGLDLFRCNVIGGGYGFYAHNCGSFSVEKCRAANAISWPFYASGGKNITYKWNYTEYCGYDGLKVGGVVASADEVFTDNLIIYGNISYRNVRDGIDWALNSARNIICESNISVDDGLSGIDAKLVYQSSTLQCNIKISGNICYRSVGYTSTDRTIGVNIQPGDDVVVGGGVTKWIKNCIIDGNIAHSEVELPSPSCAVRVTWTEGASIVNSTIDGFPQGIRVMGDNLDVKIKDCTAIRTPVFVRIDNPAGGDSVRTEISGNRQLTPNGQLAVVMSGTDAYIHDNYCPGGSTSYTVVTEALGTSTAIGTTVRRTLRGKAAVIPTGNRAAEGDVWLCGTNQSGYPREWEHSGYSSAAVFAGFTGIAARGLRSLPSSPDGVHSPLYIGERVYDTANSQIWTAYGAGTTNWV